MQSQRIYNTVLFMVAHILCFVNSAVDRKTPSFMTPCGKSPTCLKNAIQSALPGFILGSPELGISSLDPFIVDKLDLELPGGLIIQFNNGSSKGLKKCVVDSARMVGDILDIQFHCNYTIKGKYKSSGKLLMFAIDGDGDCMIKCKNLRIKCLVRLGTTMGPDGREYLQVTNFKTQHSYDGQVIYRMTNLIRGNPAISKVILDFMNQNWRLVAEEFGKPIVDFGVMSVLENVKKLFSIVPLHQLLGSPNN